VTALALALALLATALCVGVIVVWGVPGWVCGYMAVIVVSTIGAGIAACFEKCNGAYVGQGDPATGCGMGFVIGLFFGMVWPLIPLLLYADWKERQCYQS
jgi:hypothetical protein